jgi:peptidoglycan/xylan/chitin deacetylase (PgdA/CDA1 family)
MYHSVTLAHPPGYTTVEPERFAQHLDAIKEAGYTTVTVSDALSGRELPPRPVVITFDDGWSNNVLAALELRRRGMSATFNVLSGMFHDRRYLTREEVAWLAQHPYFEVGSHTHTHFLHWKGNLDALTEEVVRAELVQSKRALEEITGRPVTTLAWPYGFTTPTLERLAKEAGYLSTQDVVNRITATAGKIERLNVSGLCAGADVLDMLLTRTHKECK